MLNQVLLSPLWQTVGAFIAIIAAAIAIIGFIHKLPKSPKTKNLLYIITVSLTVLLIAGTSGVIYVLSPSSQSPITTSSPTIASLSPTPSPPSPTATSTPISEATPTATSLPTGVADCSGGQNVGWSKWLSNGEWIDNGAITVNKPDPTSNIDPTLAGPVCGLLKIGSHIRITFTMQGDDGNLYLLVGGTDNGWYGIQFNYGGPNIVEDSTITTFPKQYLLRQGSTYTFIMEIATDGNINLLDGNNGPILSYGAVFVPNGHWGLKTFNGTFAVNSISV